MAKDYRVRWVIDSRQPEAATQRVVKGLDHSEKVANRLLGTLSRAYDGSAQAAEKAASRIVAAEGKAAASVSGATRAVGAFGRAADSAMTASVAAAGKVVQANQKVDVGLDRLRVSAIKYGDAHRAAAEKAAKAEQKAMDALVAREKRASDRATAVAQRTSQREASRTQRVQDRQAGPDVIPIESLQVSGLKLQDAQRAAMDKAAADQQKADERKVSREQRDHDRSVAATQKASDRKAAIAQRDADRATAAKEREAAGLQAVEDRYLKRDLDQRVAYERKKEQQAAQAAKRQEKLVAKSLTDQEVALRVHNERIKQSNDRRVGEAMKAAGLEKKGMGDSIASALGLSSAMTGVGLAAMGLAAANKIVGELGDAMKRVADRARELGIKLIEDEDALRPLASVMGVVSDEKFARENAAFNVATGFKTEEGRGFRETFRGRAQITKGKAIDDTQFEEYEKQAGRIAVAKGIPAEVAGELFGSILKVENFKDKGQGSKEATARAMGALKILDAGSGEMKDLVPQLNELMAALTKESGLEGVFRNAGEAAVATSVAAEYNPREASTMVQRTAQGLRDFGDKDKKAFFKRSGITEKDSYLEAVAKANKVIEEEVAKGIPVDQVIEKFGFNEIREKRGMGVNFGARNTVLKPQLNNLRAASAPEGVAKADKDLQGLMKTDAIQNRINEARSHQLDVQEAHWAAKVKLLRDQATNKLRADPHGLNATSTVLTDTINDLNPVRFLGIQAGVAEHSRDSRISAEMRRTLKERAAGLEAGSPGITKKVEDTIAPGLGTSSVEGFDTRFAAAVMMLDRAAAKLADAADKQAKLKPPVPGPPPVQKAPAALARP